MIETPNQHSIEEVSRFLNVDPRQCLKTLIVKGENGGLTALLLRGDHELNPMKAEKIEGVLSPLQFAADAEILAACGCKPGSIGPKGLEIRVVADQGVTLMSDFVCGANRDGSIIQALIGNAIWLCRNVSPIYAWWWRATPVPMAKAQITIARGIEVGHIFQLGGKYSQAMNASVINEAGKNQIMIMGCYGIGVSRVVAAAIEQGHDERGIIWPNELAPFQVAICPMNMYKSDRLIDTVEKIYQDLLAAGIEVLAG